MTWIKNIDIFCQKNDKIVLENEEYGALTRGIQMVNCRVKNGVSFTMLT
jgi:hypothetical protein